MSEQFEPSKPKPPTTPPPTPVTEPTYDISPLAEAVHQGWGVTENPWVPPDYQDKPLIVGGPTFIEPGTKPPIEIQTEGHADQPEPEPPAGSGMGGEGGGGGAQGAQDGTTNTGQGQGQGSGDQDGTGTGEPGSNPQGDSGDGGPSAIMWGYTIMHRVPLTNLKMSKYPYISQAAAKTAALADVLNYPTADCIYIQSNEFGKTIETINITPNPYGSNYRVRIARNDVANLEYDSGPVHLTLDAAKADVVAHKAAYTPVLGSTASYKWQITRGDTVVDSGVWTAPLPPVPPTPPTPPGPPGPLDTAAGGVALGIGLVLAAGIVVFGYFVIKGAS